MKINTHIAIRNSQLPVKDVAFKETLELDPVAQDISLNLRASQIDSYAKQGSDLVITLNNGKSITLKNFYFIDEDDEKNRLFLSDSNEIEIVDLASLEPQTALGVTNASASASAVEPFSTALIFGSQATGGGIFGALSPAIVGVAGAGAASGVGVAAFSGNSEPSGVPVILTANESEVIGIAEPGATVTVVIGDGPEQVVTADPITGEFRVTPIAPDTYVVDEPVTAVAVDEDGNESDPGIGVIADETAPLAPVILSGNENEVVGIAEPGSTVTITVGNGPEQTAIADPVTGIFAITPIAPDTFENGEGITATATDAAGNESDPGTGEISEETTPPIITTGNQEEVSGIAEPGSTVEITVGGVVLTTTADPVTGAFSVTPQAPDTFDVGEGITATATGSSGNASDPATGVIVDETAPSAPVIAVGNANEVIGIAEPGSTVTITVGNGPEQSVVADPVTGVFSITPIAPDTFDNGEGITATATDAAGNESDPGTGEISVEIMPPVITTGNQEEVSGIAEPGSTVTITIGNGPEQTVIADPVTGAFTVTPQAPDTFDVGEGITATATGTGGNESDPATGVIVDETAPPAPTITSATETEVTGIAEPGSLVTITIGNGPEQTVFANSSTGAFTFTPIAPDTYDDGEGVSATATDAAGNESDPGTGTVVASAAPAATIEGVGITSTPANPTGYEEGETVEVTVTFNEAVTATGSPFIELTIGSSIVAASFASGSGTAQLVFEYVIEPGEVDADGISIFANAIVLNDGTITNGSGSDLTHTALSDDPAQLVSDPSVATVSINGGSGTEFDGRELGADLAGDGDVNGDGFDDFVVAVPRQTDLGSGEATAFVIYGGPSANDLDLSNLQPDQGFSITGGSNDFARSAQIIGDFNGDGFEDILIGDRNTNHGGGDGVAFLVYGRTDGMNVDVGDILAGDASLGTVIFSTEVFPNNANGTDFRDIGREVGRAGDFNGDGLADLLLGLPSGANSVNLTGTHGLVVFGRTNPGTEIDLATVSNDGAGGVRLGGQTHRFATFFPGGGFAGGSRTDFLGTAVETIGDINGDGFDDVAITSVNSFVGNQGDENPDLFPAVFVLLGGTDTDDLSTFDFTDDNTTAGFAITDLGVGAVTGLGDVNNDGLDDFLAGSVVVFGRTQIDNIAIGDISVANSNGFAIQNIAGGPGSVSSGDFNGDGIADFLIGSAFDEGAFLVFGDAMQDDIDIADIIDGSANGFAFVDSLSSAPNAPITNLNLGEAVEFLGDINGDGFDDIAVSAPFNYYYDYYENFGGGLFQSGGGAFVLFGNDSGDTSSVDIRNITSSGAALVVEDSGTIGDDTITGTVNSELFAGDLGDDIIIGGGGADILFGGAGDDTFVLDANGANGSLSDNLIALQSGPIGDRVATVNGGTGEDTLVIVGADVVLNFDNINPGRIENIERIDITGSGDNALSIDVSDVFDLSETSNQLIIFGDAGDTVNAVGDGINAFVDSGTDLMIDGSMFDEFVLGNAVLLIEQDVGVTTPVV